ncbi:hypothetical protein ECO319P1_00113 [Escherichia phage ECO319P1]|nr:hypothetical protein ECO319P1_00113 [Escherichia phage ECO319P1]
MTEEVENGRNVKTGQFVKGNSVAKGRPKGSRNKMTQRMLNRVSERSEDGLSMEEIMMDIAQDPNMPAELRFKAAAKVADLVYPKASSVEVKMDEKEDMSKEQIDNRLRQLLSAGLGTTE